MSQAQTVYTSVKNTPKESGKPEETPLPLERLKTTLICFLKGGLKSLHVPLGNFNSPNPLLKSDAH